MILLCPRCKLQKDEGFFHKKKKSKTGRCCWCKECSLAYCREWDRNHPECKKKWYVRKKESGQYQRKRLKQFGITQEQYDDFWHDQDWGCGICGSSDSGPRDWHIDHDHKTGIVRGLLCHHCNTAIGGLKEDPEILRRAIIYLEKDRTS